MLAHLLAIALMPAAVALATERVSFLTRYEESRDGGDLGAAVATDPLTLVIGGPHNGPGGSLKIVDLLSGATLAHTQGIPGAQLGSAVAVLGQWIVGGTPGDRGGAGGVLFVGRADGVVLDTLPNPDSAAGAFGAALDGRADLLVVGAPGDMASSGAAHLFHVADRSVHATFRSPTPAPGDGFGTAVVLAGDKIVVGAPGAEVSGQKRAGAVFVFDSVSGALLESLLPPVPTQGARFGAALAADQARILIGAPEDGDAGAAYLFEVSTGQLLREIQPPAIRSGAMFGASVALGSIIAIGAPRVTGGFALLDSGAVYLYEPETGRFLQQLIEPLPAPAAFGTALALIGASDLVVGSPLLQIVTRFSDRCGMCGPCETCDVTAGCVPVAGCAATVWGFGDSITSTYAAYLKSFAPAWDVLDLGMPTEGAADGLARLQILLDEAGSRPSVVVILYGTNDITLFRLLGKDVGGVAEYVTDRLREAKDILTARGIRAIIGLPLGVPRSVVLNSNGDPVVEYYLAGFTALRTSLRPMRPIVDFQLRSATSFGDLIHPNLRGAVIMAKRTRSAIRRALRMPVP